MVNTSKISTFKKSSHSDIKSKLVKEFDDVIHDFLNPIPMKSPPMHIHLNDNKEKPLRISTARQIPKHLQADAKAAVENLIQKGVIKRIDTPTTRCSPAFFVPKADGGVRMVTDFTNLNKSIDRPVHPFPSSAEIMQSIPPDAKFFAKLDAVHGYFQLALDEESSKLTTFLLPEGRFRYLRAPMGLSASSDEWCQRSDFLVEGLPFCKKIVDDILIWGKSPEDLHANCKTVLNRCREMNVSISAKKLEISNSIKFAGHTVSDQVCTLTRWNAILVAQLLNHVSCAAFALRDYTKSNRRRKKACGKDCRCFCQSVCGASGGHKATATTAAATTNTQSTALRALQQNEHDQCKYQHKVDDDQNGGHRKVPDNSMNKTNVPETGLACPNSYTNFCQECEQQSSQIRWFEVQSNFAVDLAYGEQVFCFQACATHQCTIHIVDHQ